jgi:hypothetical protein
VNLIPLQHSQDAFTHLSLHTHTHSHLSLHYNQHSSRRPRPTLPEHRPHRSNVDRQSHQCKYAYRQSRLLNENGNVILSTDIANNCPSFTAKNNAGATASNIWSPIGYPCTFGSNSRFFCDPDFDSKVLSNFTVSLILMVSETGLSRGNAD